MEWAECETVHTIEIIKMMSNTAITIQKANQQVIWSSDIRSKDTVLQKGINTEKCENRTVGKVATSHPNNATLRRTKCQKFQNHNRRKQHSTSSSTQRGIHRVSNIIFFFKTKRDTKFKRTTFLGATEASSTRFKLVVHSIVSQRVMAKQRHRLELTNLQRTLHLQEWWHGGTLWINKQQQHRSREIAHRRHTIFRWI